MKAAQGDLRAFDKAADNALSELGNAFGVNTSAITQMGDAVRGLGVKMQGASSTGVQAFGKLLSSITPLKAGIAGLGIGAAVAGFKALVAEADNFKSTVAGANIELATSAYIDTYRQVIHDFNGETGKAVAETESRWKKFWGTAGSTLKAAFQTGAVSAESSMIGATQASLAYNDQLNQAAQKASEAEDIANNIYSIQRKISDQSRQTADIDALIAEKRLIVQDAAVSTAARQQALNDAINLTYLKYQGVNEQTQAWATKLGLTVESYEGLYNLNLQLSRAMDEMNNLASSTPEQIDAANAQYVRTASLLAQQDSFLREMTEKRKTLGDLAAKERADEEAKLAVLQKIQDLRDNPLPSIDASGLTDPNAGPSAATSGGLIIPAKVKPVLDTNDLRDFTSEATQLIEGAFASMGDAIGGLIGDLATGGDAWENFGLTALSSLADMAQQVGKIAIATGTAMIGIEAALKFGGPGAAIAAGVALVALGAAVKAGISNAMNSAGGSYAAATAGAVASSGYGMSSSASGYDMRELNVNVTGTLRASGNELEAVLSNNANRRNHTT